MLAGLLNGLDRARAAPVLPADHLDLDASVRLYAAALSGYGLEVSRPVEETAAQVSEARPAIRLALILALDDWASCVRPRNPAEAERLWRIADQADKDEWRHRHRTARGNVQLLKGLAEEAPGLRLPAVSLTRLGQDLFLNGAHSEATALLRAACRQHPTDFWAYFFLSHYLDPDPAQPNYATLDEAQACACAAVALRPDSAFAHYGLGNILSARWEWTGAAECYQKAIELDPSSAAAHDNLSHVYSSQGDLDKAAASSLRALAIDPRFAPAHVGLGAVRRKQKDLDGAVACYQQALEIDPKYAPAHCALGQVLADRGDLDRAAACCNKAIELRPRYAAPHYILGTVRYQLRDRAGAAACFQQALAIDPRKVEAHSGLGMVRYVQGDLDGATACYQRALELDRKHADAHLGLGNVRLARGDLAEAAACYQKALKFDPASSDAHYDFGLVLHRQGDLAGAAEWYQRALNLDPRNAFAHGGLGSVLREQGDPVGAASRFQQALAIDPTDLDAHFNLGAALYDQGRLAEARTSWQRCLELCADNDPLRARAAGNIRRCERMQALEAKLLPVLEGRRPPAEDERLDLAEVCHFRQRYAAAARLRREAFAHDPRLADDLQSGRRYDAACSAALAGCGRGQDAKDLDDKARAGWRNQALAWLREDLKLRGQQLDSGQPENRQVAGDKLRWWQKDADLVGLRDPALLAKLPADDQEAWRKLWAEVQALVKKAEEKK
jgi:tetratricopeptide (TPR) repeat protein